MRIQRSGRGRVVAEVLLNLPEIDTGFEQMRGVRMAQGVNGGFFIDTAFLERRAKGVLDIAIRHRRGGGGKMNAAASRRRKNPRGVAMDFPIFA